MYESETNRDDGGEWREGEGKECYGWSLNSRNIIMLALRPAYYSVFFQGKKKCTRLLIVNKIVKVVSY